MEEYIIMDYETRLSEARSKLSICLSASDIWLTTDISNFYA